ncbi:T9SS type A sorting domain-containing protein [Pontibacter roseus]|uniref:T9SS type A sorting domain-containing protein n=1 Tax=Pontibacter roseus TaxID=336989 RepID=UPI0003741050|nr:T9SS type A sorting domain-containing protein [Pontibacter roseus]
MKHFLRIALFFLLATSYVVAQEPLRFSLRTDVPVITPTGALSNPWSGGLNAPQFSTIDLNKDGQDDLLIFDRMLRKAFTYLAVQEGGKWGYRYAPEYEAMFPQGLEHWVLLRDYNCDGLKDIFTSTSLGIQVYRQEATNAKFSKFVLAQEALFYRSRSGTSNINMQMNNADIPAIVDMDGDGDLDILITEFSGGYTLEYYQNMQVEEGLACGSLAFTLGSDWWGQISECHGCNNFGFGVQCRMAGPLHSGHDGSALLALDLDGDGDKDLLMGNVECENLVKMENKGTKALARMESLDAAFPASSKAASFKLFPAAYYEDVTFDGIPDLLVAPNSNENGTDLHQATIEAQRSVWLYRNTGQADKPAFEFLQDDFLQHQTIDMGEGAFPAFADVDGDGKLDMLVGNSRSNRNGEYIASLSLYKNTGTATAPAYTLQTDDYLGLAARHMLSIKPSFADINRDGKPDLVLFYQSHHGGAQISYMANTAAAGQPYAFGADNLQLLHNLATGDAPFLFDVSGDGLLDMLVGKTSGSLDYYRNTGNNTFALEKQGFGGLGFDFLRRNLHPAVADLDGNGKPDLLTVDDSGELRVFPDFQDKLTGDFTAIVELLENDLTGEVHTTRLGRGLSLALAELGGPGKLYLAIGSRGGGLYLLEQTAGNKAIPGQEEDGLALRVYPNPSTSQEPVQVRAAEPVAIVLHDMIGRQVYAAGDSFNRNHRLYLNHLKAGVYLLRATSRDGKQETRKLVIQ